MKNTSVTGAGRFGVYVITPKGGRVVKRLPSHGERDQDDESADDQPPPRPGTGKLVDKKV